LTYSAGVAAGVVLVSTLELVPCVLAVAISSSRAVRHSTGLKTQS
jgi:hypothetical protein